MVWVNWPYYCSNLKANGCHVIGVDVSEDKINKAIDLGIDAHNLSGRSNLDEYIKSLNHENEIDGVIITASAEDNSIISNSAKVCRKRGRIILVGVVGLDMNHDDFMKINTSFMFLWGAQVDMMIYMNKMELVIQ